MKKLFLAILLAFLTIGVIFPNLYGSLFNRLRFGATNFPTSLDTLTNPATTDSVATVSHSGQHSNVNDAIEAIEAKVGINSSTPVTDSLLAGTSAGGSKWVTYATSSQFYATNFFATGSSTLQRFTATHSTTTNATTTSLFSTIASSTNLFTALFNGAGLATCQSENMLTWDGGSFGCEADTTGGSTIVSTTTTANMSSTTVAVAAFDNIKFKILIPEIYGAGDVSTSSAFIELHFNNTSGTSYSWSLSSDAAGFTGADNSDKVRLAGSGSLIGRYITGEFLNVTSQAKVGIFSGTHYATSTGQLPLGNVVGAINEGRFVFNSGNARITTFEVGTNIPGTFMATGTTIIIEASN